MLKTAIYLMIYLGSALMVYNIYGFISFARYVAGLRAWDETSLSNKRLLNVPILLLVMFLLGYLAVGIFGDPDIIIAGILFGGSIFVFIMYLMLRRITERVLEGEETEVKLKAAEETNRAKAGFLASISHEMRTPMNVILGMSRIELNKKDLQPETREHIEKIEQSGQRLLALITNVLSMNRVGVGALELHEEDFSMTEALAQLSAISQTLCDQKGLSFEFNVRKSAAGHYTGDVVQLKQILLSVLDNAVKYTDAPGKVSLTAEAVSDDDISRELRFTVSDTGVGIDPEYLPHIFEIFTQEDGSSTDRFGGSGLSLAVTKNIVDLMGGTIGIESEKGSGTTFTVDIPLRLAKVETSEEPGLSVSLEGKRVLIVEDLPENAEIVQDLLELEGVETEHAENGKIGVEMFDASEPYFYDAVLMDLRMPVMDGLEAARRIRALDRKDAQTVPIIALTANAFESDVRASIEAGMNAHLAKPTDSDLLYDTLRRFIAASESS